MKVAIAAKQLKVAKQLKKKLLFVPEHNYNINFHKKKILKLYNADNNKYMNWSIYPYLLSR